MENIETRVAVIGEKRKCRSTKNLFIFGKTIKMMVKTYCFAIKMIVKCI